MPRRKSPANFFARPTRICTKCVRSRCDILLFTVRASGQIWRSIDSPGAFTPGNRSSNSVTARRAAINYAGPLFDIFNLGESETIELRNLIAAIENALGKKAKINRLPEQPGDMPLTCADISKPRKLLGYNPKTKFSEGLLRFVDWFLRSRTQR